MQIVDHTNVLSRFELSLTNTWREFSLWYFGIKLQSNAVVIYAKWYICDVCEENDLRWNAENQ